MEEELSRKKHENNIKLLAMGKPRGSSNDKEMKKLDEPVTRNMRRAKGEVLIAVKASWIQNLCRILQADVRDLEVEEHPNFFAREIRIVVKKKKRSHEEPNQCDSQSNT